MARAGHITCPVCDTAEVAVSITGAGTYNIKCHRCEFSGYGKPGSKAARLIASKMTPDDDAPTAAKEAPQAQAKAAPPAPKAPAPKPRNSVFSMDHL